MNNWEEMSFTEAVVVNPSVQMVRGEEYPFVDMKAIEPSIRNVSESEIRAFKGSGSRFMPNDTLMARITPCLENGKIARYIPKVDDAPAHGSTEFIIIRGRDGITNNDFAYYLTKWQTFRYFAISQMTGSSGRQRVPVDSLSKFQLNLPPLPEQKAIAHILGSLDDKIELNRQMNQTLEAMAAALFKSWFVDFDPVIDNALAAGNPIPEELAEKAQRRTNLYDKRKPLPKEIKDLFGAEFEPSALGPIPKGWKVKPLDKIAEFLNGLACQKYPPKEGERTLPVIKIRELRQGISANIDLATENVPEQYIVNDGDVLFSWSGSLLVDIWSHGRGVLNQHVFKVSSDVYPKWFYFYWTAHHLMEFQRIAADKATTMGHIKRHHLSDAKVLVPQEPLLEAMNVHLASFFENRLNNELEAKSLSKLRDTLLPKLISGQLRVPDAEKLTEGVE